MKKGIFEGKLLVCDMDGTLLDGKQRISEKNLNAINRFVEQGGMFTLATGRDEKSISGFLEVLPVNVPVIIYNGAAVYDVRSGKLLWNSWLPEEAPGVLQELMDYFPEMGVMVFKRSNVHFLRDNDYTDAFIRRDSVEPIYTAAMEEIPLPWTKVILAWEPEKHKEVEQYLSKKSIPFRNVYSQPDFIEFLSNDATKGRALSELSGILGIPQNRIIAMGDNLNDVEMIEYAGTGIAVSNAHAGLKRCADLCCCHHEEHAVAEVIDWIYSGKIACA